MSATQSKADALREELAALRRRLAEAEARRVPEAVPLKPQVAAPVAGHSTAPFAPATRVQCATRVQSVVRGQQARQNPARALERMSEGPAAAEARRRALERAREREARRNEDTSCSNASFFASNARRLCPSRRSRPPGSRRSRLEALSFSRCAASSRGLGGCRGPVGSPCHPEGSGAWTPSSGANAEKSSSANRGLSTAAIASAPTEMTKERAGRNKQTSVATRVAEKKTPSLQFRCEKLESRSQAKTV